MTHGDMSTVSNQFIAQSNDPLRRPSDEFSPPPNAESTQRKRTHSSISGDFNSPYQPRPISGWAQPPQEQARQYAQHSPPYATPQSAPGPMFREPDYSTNGLAPTPQWRNAPPDLHQQSSSFEDVIPMDQEVELTDADIDK